MDVMTQVKRQMVYARLFVLIGLVAAVTGIVFNFATGVMTGLAAGFLPVGLGMILIYSRVKNNPEMQRKLKMEKEERSEFVRMKAGYTAFWISYWIFFAVLMLDNIAGVEVKRYGLFPLFIVMPFVYFASVYVINRRH